MNRGVSTTILQREKNEWRIKKKWSRKRERERQTHRYNDGNETERNTISKRNNVNSWHFMYNVLFFFYSLHEGKKPVMPIKRP